MSKFFTAAVISIIAFIVILPAITEASCLLDPIGSCNMKVYTSYQPMINWPGVTQQGQAGTFASYATAIYSIAIVIAALLAVVRLVIAGVKYMTTDIVSSKGEARNDIIGSLLGLLIIISAVVILQTINPNLTSITIAQPAPPGSIQGGSLNPLINWTPTQGSPALNNQFANITQLAPNDAVTSCQGATSANACQSHCASRANSISQSRGTTVTPQVVTGGTVNATGNIQGSVGTPVCVLRGGRNSSAVPSGSTQVGSVNVVSSPSAQYTHQEQLYIIHQAQQAGIYQGIMPLGAGNSGNTAHANSQCTNTYGAGSRAIILYRDTSNHQTLCLR